MAFLSSCRSSFVSSAPLLARFVCEAELMSVFSVMSFVLEQPDYEHK